MNQEIIKQIKQAVVEAMPPQTKTVTVAQAAKMIGVSISQVHTLIDEGFLKLKYKRVNGVMELVKPRRVTVESINEY